MKYDIDEIYYECIKNYFGFNNTIALGKTAVSEAVPDTISEQIRDFLDAELSSDRLSGTSNAVSFLPEASSTQRFYHRAKKSFTDFYRKPENKNRLQQKAEIIFNSADDIARAAAVAELWSPELDADGDSIFESWKLDAAEANPAPYRPDQIIIQLNALYSPAEDPLPAGISAGLAEAYSSYINDNPERIAVYDHPVPVFTRGVEHELEKCLAELDSDIAYEKKAGVFPSDKKLGVLISISTTHSNLDSICELWLNEILPELKIEHLDCYLLSEKRCRELDALLGGSSAGGSAGASPASIFTVQGKYACHFGALKYAQLIFEKALGTRAGFKLDTDEGIHSKDMHTVSGKTWLQQLCHPYWGGKAVNAGGKKVSLGFNIGEYVDSRDLDKLGYAEAIRTAEVKVNHDLRGPYLLFSKGACQAKGTELLNRTKKLEDFISHPLVKGGGYGIDNASLRTAVPVGFSMTGRAEDQQFYFSAVSSGVQGIFNPLLRIMHYKADVAKSEHKNEAARNVADIYRMLLFREMMSRLDVIEHTIPFPANFASPLSEAQVFWLWLYLMFRSSAAGHETEAEEYLSEGLRQLPSLLDEIENGSVMKRFKQERSAWKDFIRAVDAMTSSDALKWLESMKVCF